MLKGNLVSIARGDDLDTGRKLPQDELPGPKVSIPELRADGKDDHSKPTFSVGTDVDAPAKIPPEDYAAASATPRIVSKDDKTGALGSSDDSSVDGTQKYAIEPEIRDGLLDCLMHVARLFGLAVSGAQLTAGLPLKDGKLTTSTVIRAANRAGLSATVRAGKVRNISSLNLPCILVLDDEVCVLEKVGRRACRVSFPAEKMGSLKISIKELEKRYTEICILLKPLYDYRGDKTKNDELVTRKRFWFWRVIGKLWPEYIQVAVASVLVNLLGLALPIFMLNVYDRVLPNSAIPTLWVLAAGVGLAVAFDYILRLMRSILIDSAGRRADVLLSSRIAEHILHLKTAEQPSGTGGLVSKVRDFESVREFFSSATLVSLVDLLFIVLFVGVIYYIGGPLALVPAIAIAVVLAVGIFMQPFLIHGVSKAQAAGTHKHGILVEAISSLETVKLLGAEGKVLQEWERATAASAKSTQRVRLINTLTLNLVIATQQLVSVGVVLWGAYLFDEGLISTGVIIATVLLSSRAVAPLAGIANTFLRFQHARTALREISDVMKTRTEHSDFRQFVAKQIETGDVEFRKVSFSYPGASVPSIQNLSLKIDSGEKVAIIGRIGSGKTTFSRLLSKLYEPSSGSIIVDGTDIRQIHPAELRRALAVVSQDVVLFRGTIRDNIAFGNPQATNEAILQASQDSGAHEFIRTLPGGYDTQVAEGGRNLSGGQRQFIALARAALLDPKILVLDEPTSAMDTASERIFCDRLREFSVDRTVILSTHRSGLLSLVDKIVIIAAGEIVMSGPRNDVLAQIKVESAKAGKLESAQSSSSAQAVGE